MAAQEYYQGFQQPPTSSPMPFQGNPRPPSQSQSQSQSPYGASPRTSNGSPNSQPPYPNPPYPVTPGPMPIAQKQSPPYPTSDYPTQQYLAPPGGPPPQVGSAPSQSYFPPQPPPSGYPPLSLQRSISEPPENRRPSLASSQSSNPNHRHHRRDYDDEDEDESSEYERSRSRDSRNRRRPHRDSRSDRNTFLGAGGGAIVGDAIFPGLGTLGGLLLGGWGGHEYSRRKSQSERDVRPGHHYHHNGRKEGNYGNGITVRSEWGLIER